MQTSKVVSGTVDGVLGAGGCCYNALVFCGIGIGVSANGSDQCDKARTDKRGLFLRGTSRDFHVVPIVLKSLFRVKNESLDHR
jgi:hypothetical protein